ncbi:MAG: dihydrofolate reductase [Myxococcota bacterium]|jgi:dihydrofolate reductase
MGAVSDSPPFDMVVAADQTGGIGVKGDLPWRLKGDMARFVRLTKTRPEGETRPNAVLMGRKTWDSIPARFRPLRGRLNIVISRNPALDLPQGVLLADSLETALRLGAEHSAHSWLIGGAMIYRQAMQLDGLRQIHLTRVHASYDCDAHLPELSEPWQLLEASDTQHEGGVGYDFAIYTRAVPEVDGDPCPS